MLFLLHLSRAALVVRYLGIILVLYRINAYAFPQEEFPDFTAADTKKNTDPTNGSILDDNTVEYDSNVAKNTEWEKVEPNNDEQDLQQADYGGFDNTEYAYSPDLFNTIDDSIDEVGESDANSGDELSSEFPSELSSELSSELPSELPSEYPSELPSEYPSELPSELPSNDDSTYGIDYISASEEKEEDDINSDTSGDSNDHVSQGNNSVDEATTNNVLSQENNDVTQEEEYTSPDEPMNIEDVGEFAITKNISPDGINQSKMPNGQSDGDEPTKDEPTKDEPTETNYDDATEIVESEETTNEDLLDSPQKSSSYKQRPGVMQIGTQKQGGRRGWGGWQPPRRYPSNNWNPNRRRYPHRHPHQIPRQPPYQPPHRHPHQIPRQPPRQPPYQPPYQPPRQPQPQWPNQGRDVPRTQPPKEEPSYIPTPTKPRNGRIPEPAPPRGYWNGMEIPNQGDYIIINRRNPPGLDAWGRPTVVPHRDGNFLRYEKDDDSGDNEGDYNWNLVDGR